MMRPPPDGMPAHSGRISRPHIRRIASASRGRSVGIGASGATAGDVAFPDGVADGAADAPPVTATTALWHGGESCAALRWRHCNAAAPPGCTPEQCETKSERQAARIALVCWAVGFWGVVAAVVEGDEGDTLARAGSTGFRIAGCSWCPGSVGDVSTAVGVAVIESNPTAVRQAGERSAALAFRQSITSGLLG